MSFRCRCSYYFDVISSSGLTMLYALKNGLNLLLLLLLLLLLSAAAATNTNTTSTSTVTATATENGWK